MNRYLKWLDQGIERLSDDYFEGRFEPFNESDVKCHLYHKLVAIKSDVGYDFKPRHRVQSEISIPGTKDTSTDHIDLAIGILKARKRDNDKFEPRVLIEIKKTSKRYMQIGSAKRKLKKDVEKLRKYIDWLRENKPSVFKELVAAVILLFFVGADRKSGIGMRTVKTLEKIKEESPDIEFRWCPS